MAKTGKETVYVFIQLNIEGLGIMTVALLYLQEFGRPVLNFISWVGFCGFP